MNTVASNPRMLQRHVQNRAPRLPWPCHLKSISTTNTRHLRPPAGRLLLSQAASNGPAEVYQGRFGSWSIEQSDVLEVYGYRAGISLTAAGMVKIRHGAALYGICIMGTDDWTLVVWCCAATIAATAAALLPEGSAAKSALSGALDPICLAGAAGLGVSLQLIHIYFTVLKRTLQALWATGLLGAIYLMVTQDESAAEYVVHNPWAVWLVGPMFAAITGVAFKEGFCYGKFEAAGLFGAVPLLLLGHLSGLVPEAGEKAMLASVAVLMAIFAGRKYTQALKDDIGDKSIFVFQSLGPEEQEALLRSSGMSDE